MMASAHRHGRVERRRCTTAPRRWPRRCLMAVRAHRKSRSQRILMPAHGAPGLPRGGAGDRRATRSIELVEVPYCDRAAATPRSRRSSSTAADGLRGAGDPAAELLRRARGRGRAHRLGARATACWRSPCVNPTVARRCSSRRASGARKGADIAVGDGQPLGVPLSSRRPVLRLHGRAQELVRQMPGRIVGRTVDLGRQARLHPHPAGARAAHPPLQGDLQHLHQPGPAGHGRDHLHGAARAATGWRSVAAACHANTQRAGGSAHARSTACSACSTAPLLPRGGGARSTAPVARRAASACRRRASSAATT
ncbi:MAG: hypothetical protein MZV65_19530 [Chromatiales bacterium]|nr:hypothetical protein [Chromatiales bacterium]